MFSEPIIDYLIYNLTLKLIYLATFLWCRVYLPSYVAHIYGTYSGRTAAQTFINLLRFSCQVGTTAISGTNGIWWLTMVSSLKSIIADVSYILGSFVYIS